MQATDVPKGNLNFGNYELPIALITFASLQYHSEAGQLFYFHQLPRVTYTLAGLGIKESRQVEKEKPVSVPRAEKAAPAVNKDCIKKLIKKGFSVDDAVETCS